MMGMLNPHKRPAPVKLPSTWFALYPKRGHHMMFWGIVARKVKEQKVKATDHASVRTICRQVDAMLLRMQEQGREHARKQGQP